MYNNYTITSVTQEQNGDASVVISITGDNSETPSSLTISTNDPSNINQQVQDTIGNLNAIATREAALAAFIASPPIGQSLAPTPTVPTADPQIQYQEDLNTLEELIAAKTAMGIDPTQDSDVQTLQAYVANEYQTSFVIPTATLTAATNLSASKLNNAVK